MDRKSKVWLIVLIILLILAAAGMVISRNQLADIQAQADAVTAQLAQAQDSSAALQTELDAAQTALTESQTALNDAQTALTEVQTALTESQSEVEALSASLAAEQEKVAAYESAPAGLDARVAELEGALAEAEARIAELSAQTTAVEPVAQTAADNTDNGEKTVVVTDSTQWRSAPGEEGQTLTDLNAGDELHYMNQTSTDALNNKWYCAELNGQTGWVPAADAKIEPASEVAAVSGSIADEVNTINSQLTEIMESDVTDEEKLAKIAELEVQLNQTLANLAQVSAELENRSAELMGAESALETANAAIAEAEAALTAKTAELEAANAAIAELEAQIDEIGAQNEAESAAIAELEAQLAAAQEAAAAIETELAAARAEYEKRVAELEAYLLSRELIDGEAHVATSSSSEISVAADGMTAAFNYTNTSVSGNTVVLTIVKDDAELYRSEPIAPGQGVSEIVLAEALAAGTHEAVAVTTVYNEDGSVQLTSRVPVTLNVAE